MGNNFHRGNFYAINSVHMLRGRIVYILCIKYHRYEHHTTHYSNIINNNEYY